MDSDDRQQPRAVVDWSELSLFLVSVCAVVLCGWIIWPFLPALTGAMVLVVVTRHPYRWLAGRIGNSSLTAALALILVIFAIIAPSLSVAYGASQHVLAAVRSMQSGVPEQELRLFLSHHPRIAEIVGYLADNIDPAQALEKAAGASAGKLAAVLGSSITALLQTVVMLFVLFFLFRDAGQALGLVRKLLPLKDVEASFLIQRVRTAVTALVLGRFLVATIQGTIAGLTFALLGVGGATLLGVATMLFALVPAVGAYVVWLPVVIYLAMAHVWVKAIVMLAVGALIISTLDNLLYPLLVGSRLRLHIIPIFLSIIGGIWLFGVSGLILGPLTLNITLSLLTIWRSRTHGEPLTLE
jgi:predicted PurR-regulated permease PerM